MAVTVGTLLVELRAKTDAFTKGMSDARRLSFDSAGSISDSIGQIGKAFDKLKWNDNGQIAKSLKSIGGIAVGVGAGIATAMAAAGVAMVKTAVESADKFNKLSQSTGVAVETLTGFAYVAKLSGIDAETLAKSLGKLSKNAYDAITTGGQTAKSFKNLGVSVKDAAGQMRPVEDIILDISEKFSSMKDGTLKTALAIEVFGKAGAVMIPMLNQGRAGMSAMLAEAKRLGVVLNAEAAAGAERFHDNLERLEVRVQGVGLELMKNLLPSLERVSEELSKASQQADFSDFMETMASGLKNLVVDLDAVITGLRMVWLRAQDIGGVAVVAGKSLGQNPLATAADIGAYLADRQRRSEEYDRANEAWMDRAAAVLNPGKTLAYGNGLIGPPLPPGFGKTNPALTSEAKESGAKAIQAARMTMLGITKEIAAGEENQVRVIELKYKELLEKVRAIFAKFPALRKEYAGMEVAIEHAKGVQLTAEYKKQYDDMQEAVEKAMKAREIKAPQFPQGATVLPNFVPTDAFERQFEGMKHNIQDLGRYADETWTNMRTPVERYAQQLRIVNELLKPTQQGAKPYIDQDTAARAKQAAWDQMSRAMDEALMNTQKFSAGAQVAFKQYAEYAKNAAQQSYDVFAKALSGMDSAVHDFFRNGKADWGGLAKDTWADVMTAMFRKNILGPIAGGLAQAFGMPADALNRPDGSSSSPWHVIVDNSMTLPGVTSSSGGTGASLNGFGGLLGKIGVKIASWFTHSGTLGNTSATMGGGNGLPAFEFAAGGVMTPGGPLRLPRFASGGISHHAAIFGEGRSVEAAVPLPDGRSIPAKITGNIGSSVVANFYGVTDADSFKRSQSQILSLLGNAVDKAQRRNG